MSPETILWLKAGHIFGFLMWAGSLIGAISILRAHAEANAGEAFHKLEKNVGIAADVGATLTIVFGVLMLFLTPGAPGMYLKGAGYFHAKLLAVVLLIVFHVIIRVTIRKFRNGEVKPVPMWLFAGTELATVAIIVLVVVKPF